MAIASYKLLTVAETLKFLLENKLVNKHSCDLKHIENILQNVQKVDNTIVENQTTRYLKWCKECEFVKVNQTTIPGGILSEPECTILDIKVQPKNKGPDDPIYIAYEDIRQKVARGNCIFESPGSSPRLELVIRGFKKFTGGPGDDDDFTSPLEMVWEKFFLKPIREARYFAELEKVNGDAAHLAARWHNGGFLIFAGSKNVHLAFRNKEDIEKYEGWRFNTARKIAYTVLELLGELEVVQAESLLGFLHYSRLTANLEILQQEYMHVQNLSNLLRSELHFIAWMSCDFTEDGTSSLCGLPPDLGIKVASAFGLQTVNFKMASVAKFEEQMAQVRLGYGYEGAVFYLLDQHRSVIGIVKRKTIWYVVVRAIREKSKMLSRNFTRGVLKLSLSEHIKKMEFRLLEIQKWLGLENSEITKWKKLGEKFLKWVYGELVHGKLKQETLESQFPVIWKKFLENTKCSDKIGP